MTHTDESTYEQGIKILTSRRIKKVDTWSIETEQDGTSKY